MPSREPELYKDKIEVSLDGRQIFYLFFGGAVIVGLVFVLGVMVGRRVEARGHLDRAQTQIASDPLAALDRLERSDNLSFHGALTGTEAPTDVDRAIGELEKHRAAGDPRPARLDAKPDARPEVKPDVRPEVKPEVVSHPDADKSRSDKHDGDKHDGDKHAKKHDDKSDKPVTRPDARAERSDDHPDARPDRPDAKADKTEAKSEKADKTEAKSEKADKTEAKSEKADKSDAKSKADVRGKFTLQLSSFQDKTEAEAFLSSMKSAGFQPYLTEAEVNGKGTFYRVRLGSYRSLDAASDAKAEYEKSAKKTAQVMRL
jgi:DedD protein